MSNSITVVKGTTVRIKGTFKDKDTGLATDPGDVHLYYKDPDGIETTEEYNPGDIVKDGTGVYYFDLLVSKEGSWVYRMYSSTSGVTAAEGTITSTDLSTAETAGSIDIVSAALGPRRMKTDEGFIEEHKLQDLIEADRYSSQKDGSEAPPYGMRVAKLRPGGSV